jgi:hypothetical protein
VSVTGYIPATGIKGGGVTPRHDALLGARMLLSGASLVGADDGGQPAAARGAVLAPWPRARFTDAA